MNLRSLTLAIGTILFSVAATAQSRADFSGRWVAVDPQSVAGHELRIKQDATTLTIEQARLSSTTTFDTLGRPSGAGEGARESTTYRLDGKPTVAASAGGSVRSVLHREAGRVVLSDTHHSGVRFERVLSLDAGGRLVLEQRRPAGGNDDPAMSSGDVLKARRIVFEKR